MSDELMRGFLQQTIECVDAFSDALNYILQHYDVRASEKKEFGSCNATGPDTGVCCAACAQRLSLCCPCPHNHAAFPSVKADASNRPVF